MLTNNEINAIDKAEGGRLVNMMSSWLHGCNSIQSGKMFDKQFTAHDKEKISLLCVYFGLCRLESDNQLLFENSEDSVRVASHECLSESRRVLSGIDSNMPQLLQHLDDFIKQSPTNFVEQFDRESALNWNAVLIYAIRLQFTSNTTPTEIVKKMDEISLNCKKVSDRYFYKEILFLFCLL